MFKYAGSKFCALKAGTLIQQIIDDIAVIAILASKRTNMPIDDPLGQQCGELESVGARVHEKAIVDALGKALANLSQLILHVEAAHTKSVGQRVSEQIFDGNTF